MDQKFYNAVEASPVIAAIKDMDGLEKCCQVEDIKVVFILFGDICSIDGIVQKLHEAGKIAMVHMDLIIGLSSKEIAVEYIKNNTHADGIISTKPALIKRGRELGLYTVLRFFILDSIALRNVETVSYTHLVQALREYAAEENCEVFVVCAQIEQEIAELEDDEKKMFLEDLGLKESGLEKLIRASYHLLGLISYLTAGEPEVRAWTITKGTKAPQAAGKIHTDFERGFIRAEVVSYDDLIACGSHAAAREKGLIRLEGKDYVVQDGDIMLFRFNV